MKMDYRRQRGEASRWIIEAKGRSVKVDYRSERKKCEDGL